MKELVADPDKVLAMTERLAEYLSEVLQIVDTTAGATEPLVEIIRQEMHHYPCPEQKRRMHLLEKQYEFIVHCEDQADRMRRVALGALGQNIDLNCFAQEHGGNSAYYCDDEVIKDDATPCSMGFGATGQRLMRHLFMLSMAWLDDLDKVLSAAGGMERTDAVTHSMQSIKGRLAGAISKRLSLMSTDSVLDDELSARALQELVQEAYGRARSHAAAQARIDVRALELLRQVAKDPTSEETRRILVDELRMLSYVVHNVPCELAVGLKGCGLCQLERALAPTQDVEVRIALVTFWADNNGDAVVRTIDAVMSGLRAWKPPLPHTFEKLLVVGQKRPNRAVLIPHIPFLCMSSRMYVLRSGIARRSGLDEQGERTVRLVRCVWEIASQAFAPGIVGASVVEQVAMDSMLLARRAAQMVRMQRDASNKGFTLDAIVNRLHDMHGEDAHESVLSKAVCALSAFRMDELEAACHTEGPILCRIDGALTRLTRDRMSVKVHQGYRSFATDALVFTLPVVSRRREVFGVEPWQTSNALLDLLCSIPRASNWKFKDGPLRLDLEDLRLGHRSTRGVLDALHDHSVLVKRVGGGKGRRKITYVFDTFALQLYVNGQ
tara:strand:+ start:2505 stop:4328 length:1824 start_codon:yes stop_codon:yes gene_type:complete